MNHSLPGSFAGRTTKAFFILSLIYLSPILFTYRNRFFPLVVILLALLVLSICVYFYAKYIKKLSIKFPKVLLLIPLPTITMTIVIVILYIFHSLILNTPSGVDFDTYVTYLFLLVLLIVLLLPINIIFWLIAIKEYKIIEEHKDA